MEGRGHHAQRSTLLRYRGFHLRLEGAYEDCAAILLEDEHMGAPLPLTEACLWIDQYHRTHGEQLRTRNSSSAF
jgi:hypothetical protein